VTLLGLISLTVLLIVRAVQGQSLFDPPLWWALVGPINGFVVHFLLCHPSCPSSHYAICSNDGPAPWLRSSYGSTSWNLKPRDASRTRT